VRISEEEKGPSLGNVSLVISKEVSKSPCKGTGPRWALEPLGTVQLRLPTFALRPREPWEPAGAWAAAACAQACGAAAWPRVTAPRDGGRR